MEINDVFFILLYHSIGGMAILYVLKLQDNESGFISEGSANSQGQDTVTSSVGLDGTKTVPPVLNVTVRTTIKPRKTIVSSLWSSGVFPTTNIVTPRHTEHSSVRKTSGKTATKSLKGKCYRVWVPL